MAGVTRIILGIFLRIKDINCIVHKIKNPRLLPRVSLVAGVPIMYRDRTNALPFKEGYEPNALKILLLYPFYAWHPFPIYNISRAPSLLFWFQKTPHAPQSMAYDAWYCLFRKCCVILFVQLNGRCNPYNSWNFFANKGYKLHSP